MKNKKPLLGLLLFALVLVLGVGYAVVNNVALDFNGSATVGESDIKVDIASVTDQKTGAANITHTLTEHSKSDKFTISNMSLNETVTMVYTIDNHETDVDATLKDKVALENNNEEYFTASYKIDESSIPKSGSTTVTVTVKMIKTPVKAEDGTAEISFGLEAAPVDNAN